LKVQNGAVSIVDPSPSLTATAELDAEHSGGYVGMNNTINITVSNSGDMEYYDMVHVRMSESSDMPAEDIYATGITAPAGGSTTFNFAYTPEAAGTYNFWILDKELNEIGRSSIEFKTTTAPVLSLVSVKCASASGEKVYANYWDDKVEMDKVNDTKADFVFEIKNDGGYYEGLFVLYKYTSDGWGGMLTTLRIPANATTKFTFTAEGEVGDVVGYMLDSYDESVSIAPLDPVNMHFLQENPYAYWPISMGEICYLAGNVTVGVSAIKAEKENNVYYNLRGEKVDTPSKGVYIKNGKKYIFK
ncbi:MAG: hypothetical protein K2K03_04600, partial [Prevotella sp.]|nr:hypothetical protein [Prevotella sp.]